MRNIVLSPFYKKLYFKIAQFIFSDNRIHHIVAIENTFKDKNSETVCEFAQICKNFSLPATILDRNFQILSQGENTPCFSLNTKDFDVVVSLFNLHNYNLDEQQNFLRQIRQTAPKAIFLEYENPERNLGYLGYLPVIFGQYLTFCLDRMKNRSTERNSIKNMKSYLKQGALEGVLYNLCKTVNTEVKILKRHNLGIGGIGMAYVEWE